MTTSTKSLITQFFEFVFGEEQGYVCIATADVDKENFRQSFFSWPDRSEDLAIFIQRNSRRKNVWYCVNLLSKEERKKDNCLPGNVLWADLDACDYKDVDPPPQCVVESSPNRYQGIWRLDGIVDPYVAENYSKKIAYKYAENGADPSGWDLTQLLRVPFTFNYKYDGAPKVQLIHTLETLLPITVFEDIEDAAPDTDDSQIPDIPNPLELPDPEQVIYKYWINLQRTPFKDLYENEPDKDDDWSKILWRLINICIEAGMDNEEAFAVAIASGCNKYRRDDRPISLLWREVNKADRAHSKLSILSGTFKPIIMPEIANLEFDHFGFFKDYMTWGEQATDAVPAYHELGAFVTLSAVLAQSIRLKTSYGEMVPNLWGLVLGDSTLTRKTTAMRMCMDLIQEIDQDMILATDGSVEGILTGLSLRPSQTSIFYKDEVSGFFDSMNKRDYLAGMPETLTQLYDVPRLLNRRLRKETITIQSPIFIFFGGGIKDKVHSLVSDEYILSGFLPRFLIVSGDADVSKIRTTGPATPEIVELRQNVLRGVADLYETYVRSERVEIAGQIAELDAVIDAQLTEDAWKRYQELEMDMVKAASESPMSMLALPTFERMSRSVLKMSVLVGATRQEPQDGRIEVEETDVSYAASFIQRWGNHTIDLIQNSGRTTAQRTIDRVLEAIEKNPGIARGKLMQHYKLRKREMDEIQGTLEDRGQVKVTREGRGVRLWAV